MSILTIRVFDFPDPNSTSEQRMITVGPMQRLFFMNSKFIAQQSKAFAERIDKEVSDDRAHISRAYQILFDRAATDEEISLGLELVEGKPGAWAEQARDPSPVPSVQI